MIIIITGIARLMPDVNEKYSTSKLLQAYTSCRGLDAWLLRSRKCQICLASWIAPKPLLLLFLYIQTSQRVVHGSTAATTKGVDGIHDASAIRMALQLKDRSNEICPRHSAVVRIAIALPACHLRRHSGVTRLNTHYAFPNTYRCVAGLHSQLTDVPAPGLTSLHTLDCLRIDASDVYQLVPIASMRATR